MGPAHDQTFTVAATLEGKRLAVGEGSSRQRAEEIAASGAMELLAADPSRDGDDAPAVAESRS